MPGTRGLWRICAPGLVFAHLGVACFAVKIDTTDTLTTVSTLPETITETLSDTLTMTSPTSPTSPTTPTTDPPTTTGPTTDPPTTIGPTTITLTETTTIGPTTDTITIGPASDTITDPTFTVTTDPFADCGNGIQEAGEECDDGNTVNTDACTNACKDAICGDGIVRTGVEVCDDGINNGSYEGCAQGCSALGPRCGDGTLQAAEGELCDDGNQTPGDGCHNCVNENLPPECVQAVALASPTRNVAFASDAVECDLALPEAGQWSRFVGAAGRKLPLSAPPQFSCGTHAPGWLDGTEPAQGDGVVSRQVCFHWEDDICQFAVQIAVRNCGPFLAYRLPPVPACALRYCGVN